MSAAFGEIRVFTQENGPDVKLRVFGDEFYARYETTDGYTCIYDAVLGLYCYTILSGGNFTSTGIPISEPTPVEVHPHLKEFPDVRNEKFDVQFDSMCPPRLIREGETGPEIYGPNEGLLEGRQLNKGQVRGLAILVDFQDVRTAITPDEVSALLNAENYTANGNYCSVREYYRLMSNGVLDYSNVVIGPVRLSQKKRYYVDHLLAEEALNLVSASGLDFSQFDSLGIGAIDAVSFLYAGETNWEGKLWPHNSTIKWHYGGYRASMYQITGLGRDSSGLVIGTFCHESGHMLCRFPDLYDYGKRDGDFERSAGLGVYCLMSAGNHLNVGRTPAPICAYLRYLADWCPNRISLKTPGVYQANHGAYDTVFIYETTRPTEFFLLENRGRFGLDQHLPSSGLAIYHCDTEGSNERQGGTAEQHYQCSLLQADGRLDLEQNANQGDNNDFFAMVQGEALSGLTSPSTKMWDGSDSGLRIADISAIDKKITFLVLLRRNIMNGNGPSTEVDPLVLEHLKQQKEILEANLNLFKLTQQLEQEKLKAEVDKLKQETERQKAEADKVKGLIPAGTTKALTGETKTDEKFGYLAELAAHEAIENAAKEIADCILHTVQGTQPMRILLVDSLDVSGDDIQVLQTSKQIDDLTRAMTDQITEIEKLLRSITLEEQPGPESLIAAASLLPILGQVLASAPGAISWAADIASYFHVEDTYKSVEVTVPLAALQAGVAGAMMSSARALNNAQPPASRSSDSGVNAKHPTITVCFPNFHTFGTLTDLPILKGFRDCTEVRRKLGAMATQLKILIDSSEKDKEGGAPSETIAKLKLAEAAYATSQSLVQAFDDFSKLMSSAPEGKGSSPLVRVAMREYLKKGMGQEQNIGQGQNPSIGLTYLLYLNIVSSGGEVAIRKTLWWQRDIVFLGGCVVTFALADMTGKILTAGTQGKLIQAKYTRGQSQRIQFVDLTELPVASGVQGDQNPKWAWARIP